MVTRSSQMIEKIVNVNVNAKNVLFKKWLKRIYKIIKKFLVSSLLAHIKNVHGRFALLPEKPAAKTTKCQFCPEVKFPQISKIWRKCRSELYGSKISTDI
jgi:hypothetical protein